MKKKQPKPTIRITVQYRMDAVMREDTFSTTRKRINVKIAEGRRGYVRVKQGAVLYGDMQRVIISYDREWRPETR